MLVNLQEVLSYAEQKSCAIGAFNTPNLECIMAVLHNAETFRVPVILEHAQVHESVMPLNIIGPIMVLCAERAGVPVCVHLDHGESLEYIERALKLGFTSAMYDGSKLSFEENVENTCKAVEMVRKYHAGIEAEIGVMSSGESGLKDEMTEEEKVKDEMTKEERIEILNSNRGAVTHTKCTNEDLYTNPETAYQFVKATGIDALAASFGTVHGIYATKPQLDFPRIEKIKELVKIPLVMHGGSGLSPQDYKLAISKGVRKINYYSYMSREAVLEVKRRITEPEVNLYHDIAYMAVKAMERDSEKAMRIFYNLEQEVNL